MIRTILLAAAMVAATTAGAFAQQPPSPSSGEAGPPAADGMPEMKRHPMGPPRHHGQTGRMGMGKGFHLRMGPGMGLRVNCGDEPMQACLDAVMPLVDRLGTAGPMPGANDAPQPPPASD